MPVRAILDANVYISYLLTSQPEGRITRLLESGFTGQFELIIPDQVIAELREVVERKPYLSQRIPMDEVDLLVDRLGRVGRQISVAPLGEGMQLRDPDDLYLLEAALDAGADFVVTRDRDLLALAAGLQRPRIVTPAQFLAVLDALATQPPE